MANEGKVGQPGPSSEEELSRKVAESFERKVPPVTQYEVGTEGREVPKTESVHEQRRVETVERTIKQLPGAVSQVTKTITRPVGAVSEQARHLLTKTFGSTNEIRIVEALTRTAQTKGLNETDALTLRARELHHDVHGKDLEQENAT